MANARNMALFYHELALVLRQGLPLPQALERLAAGLPGRSRRLALRLAEQTVAGRPLSTAMADCGAFARFERDTVAAAEPRDQLPWALEELAAWQRRTGDLARRLAGICGYAGGMAWAGLALLALWLFVVLPLLVSWGRMWQDMLWGEPMPFFCAVALRLGEWTGPWTPAVLVALAVLALAVLALVLPTRPSERLLLALTGWLPALHKVRRDQDTARLCAFLAVTFGAAHPLPEALANAAGLVTSRQLRRGVERWRAAVADGREPATALAVIPGIDPIVGQTLRVTPPADWAAACAAMADDFRRRAEARGETAMMLYAAFAHLGALLFLALLLLTVWAYLLLPFRLIGGF